MENTMQSNAMATVHTKPTRPTRPMSEARRIRKPLMERKRRERINCSLEQLALLLKEAKLVPEEKPIAKMEKADILELTVKLLQSRTQEGKSNYSKITDKNSSPEVESTNTISDCVPGNSNFNTFSENQSLNVELNSEESSVNNQFHSSPDINRHSSNRVGDPDLEFHVNENDHLNTEMKPFGEPSHSSSNTINQDNGRISCSSEAGNCGEQFITALHSVKFKSEQNCNANDETCINSTAQISTDKLMQMISSKQKSNKKLTGERKTKTNEGYVEGYANCMSLINSSLNSKEMEPIKTRLMAHLSGRLETLPLNESLSKTSPIQQVQSNDSSIKDSIQSPDLESHSKRNYNSYSPLITNQCSTSEHCEYVPARSVKLHTMKNISGNSDVTSNEYISGIIVKKEMSDHDNFDHRFNNGSSKWTEYNTSTLNCPMVKNPPYHPHCSSSSEDQSTGSYTSLSSVTTSTDQSTSLTSVTKQDHSSLVVSERKRNVLSRPRSLGSSEVDNGDVCANTHRLGVRLSSNRAETRVPVPDAPASDSEVTSLLSVPAVMVRATGDHGKWCENDAAGRNQMKRKRKNDTSTENSEVSLKSIGYNNSPCPLYETPSGPSSFVRDPINNSKRHCTVNRNDYQRTLSGDSNSKFCVQLSHFHDNKSFDNFGASKNSSNTSKVFSTSIHSAEATQHCYRQGLREAVTTFNKPESSRNPLRPIQNILAFPSTSSRAQNYMKSKMDIGGSKLSSQNKPYINVNEDDGKNSRVDNTRKFLDLAVNDKENNVPRHNHMNRPIPNNAAQFPGSSQSMWRPW